MRPYARALRVGEQIHRMLSELLTKGVSDPRLELVTVTGVDVSPDLKFAKVYVVSTGGKRSPTAVVEGLESAQGYLKRTLAPKLGLRFMPALRFIYDSSFDYGERIDDLLKSVGEENGTDH
jgi:ribosome-binding factor A